MSGPDVRLVAVRLASARWLAFWAALILGLQAQDGTQQWAAQVSGFVWSSSAAISADGRTIYVGVETGFGPGRVIALTSDGAPAWPTATQAFTRSQAFVASPALSRDGSVLYIGGLDSRLYALDARTGALKWEKLTGGYISSSVAVAADGTIYVGSSDGRLYAFTDTGSSAVERWPPFATGGSIESSPAIGADGTVYVASLDRLVYAVAPDGTEKWRYATGAPVFSSPAIGRDGTIYIGSNDQRLHAIAPDGTKRWDYFTNGVIDASPVIGAAGTVYVASGDGYLYALNPDGPDEARVRWKVELGVELATTAAVRADGVIILGGEDNKVRAFGPDGARRWEFRGVQGDQEAFVAAPTVAPDGSVYIGSTDGRLYRINGSGSPLSTVSSWPAFRRDIGQRAQAERVSPEGRLVNLSTRAGVAAGQTLIVGFAVETAGERLHLLRAVGPTLADFGVVAAMPNPRLQLFVGQTPLPQGGNDDWEVPEASLFTRNQIFDTTAAVGAFPLREGSKDAAVLALLRGGVYSAHATSAEASGGVVLVEAYDARTPDAARLVNLSTRNRAGTGENVMIAGFVVGGTEPTRLLLRGIGPGLAQFGVAEVLARPRLALFSRAAGATIRTNEGWTSGGLGYDLSVAAASAGAFALPPGSADSALVATLAPGDYTIEVSGLNGSNGEALAEIYVLP